MDGILTYETGSVVVTTKHRGVFVGYTTELVGARHVLFVSHSPEVQDLADARILVEDGKVEVRS